MNVAQKESGVRKRVLWVGIIAAVVVLAAGGVYYTRGQPVAEPQRPRDPGLTMLFAIRTVERCCSSPLPGESEAVNGTRITSADR